MLVRFVRAVRSAFHRKTVNGRVHIWEGTVLAMSVWVALGRSDLAFCSVILLQHLNVWVVGQAVLANGREV